MKRAQPEMKKHWVKNISLQLYTSDLVETLHFYSVILGINCDNFSDTQVLFSFNSTAFVFEKKTGYANDFPYSINFEVYDLDKLWEAIRLKVAIIDPINDSRDGIYREFKILDNNGYRLRFFEENDTKQLSLNFYNY